MALLPTHLSLLVLTICVYFIIIIIMLQTANHSFCLIPIAVSLIASHRLILYANRSACPAGDPFYPYTSTAPIHFPSFQHFLHPVLTVVKEFILSFIPYNASKFMSYAAVAE